MFQNGKVNYIAAAIRSPSGWRERANGDGTFTIDGAKMMALFELRNLAPEVALALG
ncbi:MAG: hypothetical protein O3C52_07020 [Proteobacteria bacterium]|nr:hypothetical protein [Pseudomonadota bacterium]MDA1033102.1 hypothetical protein [Pseudomonadota bacterium]